MALSPGAASERRRSVLIETTPSNNQIDGLSVTRLGWSRRVARAGVAPVNASDGSGSLDLSFEMLQVAANGRA